MQRLPTMIAHILRPMRACCAPKSHRIRRKIARFSIETGALRRQKCTQTTANYIQKLQCCLKSSSAHQKPLQRAWRTRGAPAARKNAAKTNPNACIFLESFLDFSRRTHRTFKIFVQTCCPGCASTSSDAHTRFSVDAQVLRAKIAPNHTQNRAIFD